MAVDVAVHPENGDNALMTPPPGDEPECSLEELLSDAWTSLVKAVKDARHEWHLPVVSTIDPDGRPSARVVVLRDVQPASLAGPWLACHTDRRSRKVAELAGGAGTAAWTFYERERKVQLRVVGSTRVHLEDDVADEAWARSSASSRRCYLAPHGPSEEIESWDPNLPVEWMKSVPDLESSEAGRRNFAVVRTTVQEMERLELHHDGHLRSRWRWRGAELIDSGWLAP